MCGICGMFVRRGSPPSRKRLEAMNERLVHRGPDDSGIFRDGPVGLAHRRLRIIDLRTGDQPIFNEDRSVVVIFNGEIYNYRGLRDRLVDRGHRFTTESDTEVLVHLYEEYGLGFLDRLDGMFALALWDADRERLVLARDPLGVKPLLLAEADGQVAFASELPAILSSDVDHGGVDETAIAQYFALGYVPSPRTAFRNVSKLRPGEAAVVTTEGIGRERFYSPTIAGVAPGMDEAAAEVRRRVGRSVEKRLQSDVPLGAFLSGGVDSSIVVATMARLSEEPVKTFTVGFEESLFDESTAARSVASRLGTDHREFTVSPSDVREVVPTVLNRLGEPFADQSLVPTYVVARETSRDVTVALSGDGGDELFGGYDRYRGEFYSRYYRMLPRSVRDGLVRPAVGALPASRSNRFGEAVRKAQAFVRGGSPDVEDRHFEWVRIPGDRAAGAFAGVDPLTTGRETIRRHHRAARALLPRNRNDALARIMAVDARSELPDQILAKADTASMYNSLEVRVPLLDTSVFEYALSLPTRYKMTSRERKRVLKRAFSRDLPASTLARGKRGFDMPIGEWLKGPLADEFHATLAEADPDQLDAGAVLSVFDEHAAGRREHGKFLWTTYVFSKWLVRMREEGVLPE